MLRKVLENFASILLIFIPILIYSAQISFAEVIKADKAIVVVDYDWASSSVGNQGVLKSITLKNTSLQTFENINIEVELYSVTDVPLGSVRGAIKDVLPPGETKTFERVKLGLMHTDMQRSIARIVNADFVETGTPVLPKNLILVKDWEWLGDQFGTEGILKEITLENRSNNNYKDVKIRINDLGVRGPAKVGTEGFATSVVIHDILPAQSTSTYTNLNVGFRHPDATSTYIYVSDAREISDKEIRYIIKKEQKQGKYDTAQKVQISVEGDPDRQLTLAERYRKKLEETDVAYQGDTTSGDSTEEQTDQQISVSKKGPQVATMDDKKDIGTDAEEFDKESILRSNKSDKILPKEIDIGYASDDEVALPEHDIQVKDFKWGSGIPGSQGIIKELTLKNTSGITYSRINLEVEFRSSTGVPLASHDFTVVDVLPPNATKTYENIKLGVIVVLPNERDMIITVKDAKSSNL
ncbi:MAG: hypothetical protein ACR2NW_02295 [Thermodesulfobacteriota bacterium]